MHLFLSILLLLLGSTHADTNSADADALRNLYASLNSPSQLTGWTASGGDPCLEPWHGVQCSGLAVTQITLSGLGLTGSLSYKLNQLISLIDMDLSNNHITGSLPYQLPPNLQTLNLAKNGLTGGNLPYSISLMTNLTSLNVGNNQLSGSIADVFQNLIKLSTLDMSFNMLTGLLPPGFSSLSSLSILHLQNNQLSGDLSVLTNLPLQDLNVENNRFTGWIPSTFSSISTLVDDGNNFNISPAPSPRAHTAPSHRKPLSSGHKQKHLDSSKTHRNSDTSINGGAIAGLVIAGIVSTIVIVLIIGFFLWKSHGKTIDDKKQKKNVPVLTSPEPPAKVKSGPENKSLASEAVLMPPPLEKVIAGEKTSGKKLMVKRSKSPITAKAYSVADLQLATNSFSQENLIGEGTLGRVYRAEMPNSKVRDDEPLFAVKKIDSSSVERDEDFVEIISNISRLRHPNVTELVGYCTEHSQRLLVYEYFGKGTLHDILHGHDDMSKRELTWNIRVKIALGAARALEYLHEVCLPAVVHKNFKSANILLDEELNPHISDCGVAAFIRSPERKVSTQMICSFGYSAPEYAMSGIYTVKSDVYSFGVVMLELLTGRKPLDSTRLRAEQSLVRWATPQLHDIDALAKMLDVTLQGMYPAKSLSRFADIIALCVQPEPEFRPPMSEVVQCLVRLMQRATMNKRKSGDEQMNTDNGDFLDTFF